LTIEQGVTEIGWNAFKKCTGLTEILIPESGEKIEKWDDW